MPEATTLGTHKDRYIYISKISSLRSRILSSFTNLYSLQIHFRFCFLRPAKLNTTFWLKLHFWRNSRHILSSRLGRANSSFIMSVRLYGKKHGSHWADFHEIWSMSIFRKFVENIQVPLKPEKNNGYRTWRPIHIYDHVSLNYCWTEKCFRQNL